MIPVLLVQNWGTVKRPIILLKSVARQGIAHSAVEFKSSIRWQKSMKAGI